MIHDNGPVQLQKPDGDREVMMEIPGKVPSAADDEGADFPRQRVNDEDQEERQNGEDDQGYDVLLVFLPDEEDEGLHRVDEPVETGGGTAAETTGDGFT